MNTHRNITSPDGSCYEAIDSSILQNVFSYLKMFSIQCRKNITVEDKKKRMNIPNFIDVTRMTRKKNDLINSILQHSRVVEIVL